MPLDQGFLANSKFMINTKLEFTRDQFNIIIYKPKSRALTQWATLLDYFVKLSAYDKKEGSGSFRKQYRFSL